MNLPLEIIDALDAFDRETAPLGLYACEEYRMGDQPFPRLHQEWNLCLKPRLTDLGCVPYNPTSAQVRDGIFGFTLPDGSPARLRIVRTAKIKVRKFGSAYRVDPHHKYAERWNELRLDRVISDLWKPSRLTPVRQELRLFVFIGFAAESEPFAKEFARLDKQLRWAEHGTNFESRWWEDRYDRHFSVRLGAWAHLAESGPPD